MNDRLYVQGRVVRLTDGFGAKENYNQQKYVHNMTVACSMSSLLLAVMCKIFFAVYEKMKPFCVCMHSQTNLHVDKI